MICAVLAIAPPLLCAVLSAPYDHDREQALLTAAPPPAVEEPPAPAPAPPPAPPAPSREAAGPARRVSSTAYCLTGTMANGQAVHDGAVAMNGVAFGTRWRVLDGPLAGRVFTVADRIGHGSEFDVWMPSCSAARSYGRRTITIEEAP